MAAAATERACTSSPTLVRSRNTGASSHAWIGQARNTLGNPRQCVSEVPASNYSNRRAITAYGLDVVGSTGPGDVQRAVPHLPRLGQADREVVPGGTVGEPQPPHPARPDDALRGPASGQVHALRLVAALDVGAVGEH